MNIVFSKAKATDKDQLIKLLLDRQDEADQLYGKSKSMDKVKSAKFFDQILTNKNSDLIVGKDQNSIVATAALYFMPKIRRANYIAVIEDVIVAKDYRSKGVGTLLIKYVIDFCKKNPEIRKIQLNSFDTHEFYEKLGFKSKNKFFQLPL